MFLPRLVAILVATGIVAVAADDLPSFAPPEPLASDTVLRPYFGNHVRRDGGPTVIDELLKRFVTKRQSCPAGYETCSDGGCCPADTYYCDVVDGQTGCCPLGNTCTGGPVGCVTAGYVPCANDDFCCPSGYTCYRDNTGTPACSIDSGPPPTPNPDPTPNPTDPAPTDTPTDPVPTNTPNGNTNNGNGNTNSPNQSTDNGGSNTSIPNPNDPNTPTPNVPTSTTSRSSPPTPVTSSISRSSSRSSSSSASDPTGSPSSNSQNNAVANRTGLWSFVAVAPLFVFIAYVL
jgi:hypothetical protein